MQLAGRDHPRFVAGLGGQHGWRGSITTKSLPLPLILVKGICLVRSITEARVSTTAFTLHWIVTLLAFDGASYRRGHLGKYGLDHIALIVGHTTSDQHNTDRSRVCNHNGDANNCFDPVDNRRKENDQNHAERQVKQWPQVDKHLLAKRPIATRVLCFKFMLRLHYRQHTRRYVSIQIYRLLCEAGFLQDFVYQILGGARNDLIIIT